MVNFIFTSNEIDKNLAKNEMSYPYSPKKRMEKQICNRFYIGQFVITNEMMIV